MAEEKGLFKDNTTINHRTEQEQKGNLENIAKALENEENLAGFLGVKDVEQYTNKFEHQECKKVKTGTVTEKRRCRCYYYFNHEDGCNNETCLLYNAFPKKIANPASFQLVDYEVPVGKTDKVGKIDLLLRYDEQYYALEVKPPESDETLARMLAETLTYTYLANQNESTLKKYGGKQFQPAIAFFKGSKQENDYETYKSEDDLGIIWEKVKVFRLTENDKDQLDIQRVDHLKENRQPET